MKKVYVRTVLNDKYPLELLEASDVSPSSIGAVPATSAGTIPSGFPYLMEFSGKNTANAKRIMFAGQGGGSIDANTGSTPQIIVPFAGTIQSMLVGIDVPFPNTGGDPNNTTTWTVEKNGVATALVSTWMAAQINSVSKIEAGAIAVVAGDLIGVAYRPVTMGGGMTATASVQLVLVKS